MYTHPYIHAHNSILKSASERLNRQILKIDEITLDTSLSMSIAMPEYNKGDTILGDTEINRVTKKLLVTRPNQPRHLYTSYNRRSSNCITYIGELKTRVKNTRN